MSARETVIVPAWLSAACSAFFSADWQDNAAFEAARETWEAALDAHGWPGAKRDVQSALTFTGGGS